MTGPQAEIGGAIIAGGGARRMGGGHKFLKPVAGRAILDHVVARARPQVAGLVLNINDLVADSPELRPYGLPVVADGAGDGGPLAGILASLDWLAAHRPAATHLASFAADTPFFPRDLVTRLHAAGPERPVCAASGGRRHPVFALWPQEAGAALETLWRDKGVRSVQEALDRLDARTVDFSASPIDPFFNINTPADVIAAEDIAATTTDNA